MQELGYVERYVKERYRKWANERLRANINSKLWPDAARYIARSYADDANPPRMIRLVRTWSEISPPGKPAAPERWHREVFYSYILMPGDLP